MPDEEALGVVDDVEMVDTPDVETEIPPETEPGADIEPSGDETPPEETPAEPKKAMSRTEIARWLREQGESDPERKNLTKELSSALFSRDAYKEVFPDINDARTLKATMESIGGMEGLQELQTFKDEFENLDRMLDSGDPKLVDDILAQSPEGFKKIVPYAFQQLQKMDPEAYNGFINPLLRQAVSESGIAIQLEAAMASLQGGDPDLAMRRLAPALQWYKNLESLMEKDKERASYQQPASSGREEELNQREYQMNKGSVNRDINLYSLDGVKDSLRAYLKGHNLPEQAVQDLYSGALAEIGRSLMADKAFQERMDNLVRSGQLERAINLAKPYVDKAKQEAVRAVWSRRYGHLKAGAKPTNGQARRAVSPGAKPGSAATGWQQIPKQPPLDTIDKARTTQDMMFAHRAITVDGRRVQWPR